MTSPTTALAPSVGGCQPGLDAYLRAHYGEAPFRATRLDGGRNSRVYRVDFAAGRPTSIVVKHYHLDPQDGRDRLGTEFSALSYLARHGVDVVPGPLFADREAGFATYGLIEGDPVDGPPSPGQVGSVIAFCALLRELSGRDDNDFFVPASEAFFTTRDLLGNLKARRARLDGVAPASAPASAMLDLLRRRFDPLLRAYQARLRERGPNGASVLNAHVPREQRVLSPSDFGFHNALRRPDGTLAFLDFEYFGWDDPAKLVCDFVLHPHPKMALESSLRCRFLEGAVRALGPATDRANVLLTLFCLKWSLILLNEFNAADARRREFALDGSLEHRLTHQLDKSRAMFRRAEAAFAAYPYSLESL